MKLDERATSLNLPLVAQYLKRLSAKGWVAAPVTESPSITLENTMDVLQSAAAEGLPEAVVSALLQRFAMQPVELGLLSYDALCGSFGLSDSLLTRLRRNALVVAEALPPPGARGTPSMIDCVGVVARVATPTLRSASVEELRTRAAVHHDLGALELVASQLPEETLAEILDDAVVFAGLLDHAHLPTMASFYLNYLWRRFSHRDALAGLCEVLLDCGGAGWLPPVPDDVDAVLAEYVGYRQLMATGGELRARTILDTREEITTGRQDDEMGTLGIRLVDAELRVLLGGTAPLEGVDAIAQARPLWRYACRVRVECVARRLPVGGEIPDVLFQHYLRTFGGDAAFWRLLLLESAHKDAHWLRQVIHQLTLRLARAPHDVEAWRGLAEFLDDRSTPSIAELTDAVEKQASLTR